MALNPLLSSQRVNIEEQTSLLPTREWHACLIRHRLKSSKQRNVILASFARNAPTTAPDLYDSLFRERHRISLRTVYRTLNLFCKLGFAKPLHFLSQTRHEYVLSRTHQGNDRIPYRPF
ncbi:MAG: transcriptional repressor [Nitrospirales bacterium]